VYCFDTCERDGIIPDCHDKCVKLLCEECCVPEFTTPAMALAILLTTPAFAYLLVKKRE